ncbi:MAG: hypothetical protein V2I34_04845 [Bacteroidales bacterium]|jgi:hypothetical protein|nr:hypothetical protein [Bacteroidales bacterium]
MIKFISACSMILLITACNNYNNNAGRDPVAQVGDKYLYTDQIPFNANNGFSKEDSISIVRNYIDRWIRNELILSKAEDNLSEEYQNEINNKIEETRANLMIYQYEQQMMLQKMDTSVSEQEIWDYYDSHLQNFTLQNNLLKALFLKLPVEAPNIDRARAWFRSDRQNDIQSLESYAYQFAEKFDDFGERWINMNFLLRELPVDIENEAYFLRNNRYHECSDSSFYYMVNIRDFRLKGSIAPPEYVRDDIRTIILNNRKIDFLQELETGIYNEGMRDNGFRVFK